MADRSATASLRRFLRIVAVGGLPCCIVAIAGIFMSSGSPRIELAVALGAILVLGEMWPIPVTRGDDAGDEITISSTVALSLIMIAPPGVAVLAQVVALVADEARSRRQWRRLPFNIAQYSMTIIVSRIIYAAVTQEPLNAWVTDLNPARFLLAAALAAVGFYVINNGLVAVVVALGAGRSVVRQVIEDCRYQISTSGVLLALAPVMTVIAVARPLLIAALLLPLAAVHRSARLASEREYEALHDPLTGLANRMLFNARLERLDQGNGGNSAVILIDVDHFKEINDTLGHHAGDLLLIEIASQLRSAVRETDLVARLGGDEFAVLLQNTEDTPHLDALVERIRAALHRPISVAGVRIDTSASVGVVQAQPGDDAEMLLRRADVAMYTAKRSRRSVSYYEAGNDDHSLERLTLLGELREAAEKGQIFPVYQPKIDLLTGDVVGVEALARWRHPVYGVLGPMRFIPLAENTGLIDLLTQRLMSMALDEMAALRIPLALNVSPRALLDDDFVVDVLTALAARAISGQYLTLELTEHSLMTDLDATVACLGQLQQHGIRVSIDDFGTGYSSLAYLRAIQADELKIDRSFVSGVVSETQDRIVVAMTTQLGHDFGMTVVAEGVEDELTYRALGDLGCDVAQGFHLAQPMTIDRLHQWLAERQSPERTPAARVAG